MEVKIEVNEGKFKEVLDKELEAFSKEEIKEIIRECIKKFLLEDETLKNIFLVKERYGWGYNPSDIMVEAARNIDISPAYKEIQDAMIDYLKNNCQEMMVKVMAETMVKGLTHSNSFQDSVRLAVQDNMIPYIQQLSNNNYVH